MDAFSSDRRAFLLSGGLSLLGLTDTSLAQLRAASYDHRKRSSCVLLFLFGGPSQIDLWDMKPDASEQIRGEFRPRQTNVTGIQICEHLQRLGRIMDKVCLVRSMTHRMNVHGPACSEVLSGRPYHQAPTTDQASREDWPSLSSLAMRFGHPRHGLPPSAVLPWYLHFSGQPKRIAGQTGGRMGDRYNAFLVSGDIERPEFQLAGLQPDGDLPADRINARQKLLARLEPNSDSDPLKSSRRIAHDLLASDAGRALDLNREPRSMRETYGPTAVGQSLLMARRLVEAGVSLVTVNWQDESKIDGVNTCWDTHQNNFSKLKSLLCPIFDRAFPAFIEDLHQRGLLESTLVVAVGEFGRTPKMGQFEQSANTQKTGRDHWAHAYTTILAGGGVRGGQVYGATTKDGGYVIEKPVTPADLSATILHHIGIDPGTIYEDEFQHLRNRLSDGRIVRDWS
jgi:hypothetical protein